MGWVLVLIGIAGASTGWVLVRDAEVPVWRVLTSLYAVLGVLAVALGTPAFAGDPRFTALAPDRLPSVPSAFGLGAVVGFALYLGTRAFVGIAAARWARFARHTAAQYEQRAGVGLAIALAASIVVVLGEELFWRGWVTASLTGGADRGWTGPIVAAGVAWAAYVIANLAARSLPIAAAAVVGGAVWGVLPLVTGGIAASLACHLVWTVAMLVLPPRAGRGMMTG